MAPGTRRLAGDGGVALHALVWPGGERVPFLLVHGLASNCRTWQGVGDRLHRLGHPVAAVDLRGHGLSAKPDDGYDFATLGADLEAVIKALGFDRPVLAGQSTGGNLAVELARRAPGVVLGVVGVDGGLIELADQWPEWEDCAAALAPPPIEGVDVGEFEAMLRRSHPGWTDEGVTATVGNVEVRPDGTIRPWLTKERHLRLLRALWEHRPSTFTADLRDPLLLVLADTGDGWTAAKRREVERSAAAGARLRAVWVAPGDHDLHVEQPATTAGLLAGAVEDGFFGDGAERTGSR